VLDSCFRLINAAEFQHWTTGTALPMMLLLTATSGPHHLPEITMTRLLLAHALQVLGAPARQLRDDAVLLLHACHTGWLLVDTGQVWITRLDCCAPGRHKRQAAVRSPAVAG
jgi:hypothetical protein